jgi:hypothetical protein
MFGEMYMKCWQRGEQRIFASMHPYGRNICRRMHLGIKIEWTKRIAYYTDE